MRKDTSCDCENKTVEQFQEYVRGGESLRLGHILGEELFYKYNKKNALNLSACKYVSIANKKLPASRLVQVCKIC